MRRSDIPALGGGERDNLLSLGRPGYSATINKERVACDGALILGHAAVGVRIPFEGVSGLSIREPELARACQVPEDPLDSFPMSWPGFCSKLGNG